MGYKSKNLHYVSQFYLRNFAFNLDNPKGEPNVFQMTKKGMIPDKPNTVRSICSKNNYNTRQQEIEQSQRESRYADYLKEFIKSHDTAGTNLDLDFLEFVSFMVGNNIFVREKLANLFAIETIDQNGVELTNKIVMNRSFRNKYDWSIAFSDRVHEVFRSWMFTDVNIGTDQKGFITSDNPVSIFNPEDVFAPIDVKLKYDESKSKASISNTSKGRIDMEFIIPLINVSFGRDVVMTFPVTPKLCLIGFSHSGRYDSFREGTTNGLVEFINLMTFSQANKAVYSHSKELLMETKLTCAVSEITVI